MSKQVDPFARLMKEHDGLLVQLKKLNAAASRVSRNGFSRADLRQIRAVLEFLDEEVSIHNKKEEDALFPMLEQFVEGPTQLLRNEHKKLSGLFDKLTEAVKKVEQHPDSFSALKKLETAARRISQLFVNHVHKENNILFPMARRFLSQEVLREVASRMV
jgi:hemerythrin-like domain-containing protein